MKKKLTPSEVLFNISLPKDDASSLEYNVAELDASFKKVKRALNINKEGYNLYLIDTFSKDKVSKLVDYINGEYRNLEPPKDICYVVIDDEKSPEAIFVENGQGNILKEVIQQIKSSYLSVIDEFYLESSDDEKGKIVAEVQTKRNQYVNELMDLAKKDDFEVKASGKGFSFIPLKNNEPMSEKDYEDLSEKKKDEIVEKASKLKKYAEDVLEELKEMEIDSIKILKEFYVKFLKDSMEEVKDEALINFISDDVSYDYLEKICNYIEEELVECYSMNIEDDEQEILDVLAKYDIEVIVDNSKKLTPSVIFEEDPTLDNLIGSIEYENNNGNYITDLSLINAGSMLKANEGCLILRLSSLATNPVSYHYLKKIMFSNKLSFESNKNYADIVGSNNFKPQPIDIKLKVIIIGDYDSYDVLYNSDEDFRKLFPLRVEFSPYVNMNSDSINLVNSVINNKIKSNDIFNLTDHARREIFKYLSRKSSSKNKLFIEEYNIEKILLLANNNALEKGKSYISKDEIISAAYEDEHLIEEFSSMYKDNKILISVKGEKVGSINGLAVIDTGYFSFGKPMRITCVAYKGVGRIIDIQKESHLSGKIHEKSISILKGLLTSVLNPYETIPVDFHLSFEQTYGVVEGDSASIAEIICILSSLSKRPIRQNIAVTGSVNQFGEVQPIGGVNEKIEGFFKICNIIDESKNKAVLIPKVNKDELVLFEKVEEAILNEEFNIYTMETLDDAIEVLILNEGETLEDFYKDIETEIKKYRTQK